MKIEIVNERKNPLLNRREIRFRAYYEGATPRLIDVRKKLISTLKSDDKLTILNSIKSEFGRHAAVGYVKVYANEDSMTVEPKHRIKKNFEVKEKKPEAEEKIEEAKGETEKPEEVKVEEKVKGEKIEEKPPGPEKPEEEVKEEKKLEEKPEEGKVEEKPPRPEKPVGEKKPEEPKEDKGGKKNG